MEVRLEVLSNREKTRSREETMGKDEARRGNGQKE